MFYKDSYSAKPLWLPEVIELQLIEERYGSGMVEDANRGMRNCAKALGHLIDHLIDTGAIRNPEGLLNSLSLYGSLVDKP